MLNIAKPALTSPIKDSANSKLQYSYKWQKNIDNAISVVGSSKKLKDARTWPAPVEIIFAILVEKS